MKKFVVMLALGFQVLTCFGMGNRPSQLSTKIGKDPRDVSDILGRDLKVPVFGAMGHVGIWTGDRVIEVLDKPQVVQVNTLQSFKSSSRYWGASYYADWNRLPNVTMTAQIVVPYTYISLPAKLAAVRRAYDIQKIGATYSVSSSYRRANYQNCAGLKCTGPTPGVYRCDTFIKDAYQTAGVSGINFSLSETPASLWGRYPERR